MSDLETVGARLAVVSTACSRDRKEQEMYNCHDDILAYHDKKVTLPKSEQDEMRRRRETNRSRLRNGLERDNEPAPSEVQTQGSYAHRTMVQDPNRDYDIDDGVYFWKDDLKGPNGGDKTARDAKEMVRKALHDDRFKISPDSRQNCVRVYYDAGYHVDVPVYRKVKTCVHGGEEVHVEIASTDWKTANPVAVTRWFTESNDLRSPDATNGRQLRRQVRLVKAFARSRESWRSSIATGFTITTLIANECYCASASREDEALYHTMVAMRNRLSSNLGVAHPTVDGEMLTSGPGDGRTKFLCERLSWAVNELAVLCRPNCTRVQALKAWDKVFDTTFFGDRVGDQRTKELVTAVVGVRGGPAVDRRGGGRYA